MKKHFLGIILFLLLILTTGCKKSIVGKWKAMDTKNVYYYTFNNDKTCSYEMAVAKLDCTYEFNDKTITILYKGNSKTTTFEYEFKGNTLIIKDGNGKENKFTKVNRTLENK